MTNKIPLLMVPGLLCNETLWAHQRRHLDDVAAISVIDTMKDADFPAMVGRALETAPPRFALAGLSMGGYVAFEFLRQATDRVMKLALIDTSARADTPERASLRKPLLAQAERGEFDGMTPRLLPSFLHHSRLTEEPLTAAVIGMANCAGKDVFIRQQKATMARPDSVALLCGIAVPTLVICGREDQVTPLECSEEIAAAIPGARLCVIEECGHLSSMERPHAVTALMRDWLLRE